MCVNNADTINFGAKFDERFSKTFLRELLNCGLPCPICGKNLVPLNKLNEPAVDALEIFAPHVDEMSSINRIIYNKLSELAPLHPQKNIQDLLKMLHKKAEKDLVREQVNVLNELFILTNDIPKNKIKELRELINETKNILFKNTKDKNRRFKRKSALSRFDDFALTLENDKTRVKLMSTIRALPTSENNKNAFIVKYTTRSPEEIGMKLYNKDFGTMEHITPESEGGKVVIWGCSEDNGERGNIPIPKQLAQKPQMKENLQKHINRLIEIYYDNSGSPYLQTQKQLLKEYIFTLKNEYAIASKGRLNADISKLGEIPPDMIVREIQRIKQMGETNYLRNLYKMLQDK